MKIEMKKVRDLIPYDKNPRNNDKAVEFVAKSIKEFGFKVPIVIDKENVIVAGHTRLRAAKSLKMDEVPCIVADDLTDEQIKAFRLADNKVSEQSKWNKDLLNIELKELEGMELDFDMADFGFEFEEIEEEDEIAGDVEFTEIMGEESNYLILKFDNEVDWLQLQSVYQIKDKKAYSTRKDGKINSKMVRKGVGRVVNGAEFLAEVLGGK